MFLTGWLKTATMMDFDLTNYRCLALDREIGGLLAILLALKKDVKLLSPCFVENSDLI